MWGAVIGDLAGSIYEYEQVKNVKPLILVDELIPDNAFYSDDTILTMAILDAILQNKNYEEFLKKYGNLYKNYKPKFEPYFKNAFSPGFLKWIESNEIGKSHGNGAMMRISPVGYLFNTENEVIKNAKEATIPSHNSATAISSSEIIALIIYWSRFGFTKEQIKSKVEEKYSISFLPFEKFNTTCEETISNVLSVIFECDSFEDCIKTIISYGGDTDTNACIVGSVAEAMYGIPMPIIESARTKIPNEFVELLDEGYSKIKKLK